MGFKIPNLNDYIGTSKADNFMTLNNRDCKLRKRIFIMSLHSRSTHNRARTSSRNGAATLLMEQFTVHYAFTEHTSLMLQTTQKKAIRTMHVNNWKKYLLFRQLCSISFTIFIHLNEKTGTWAQILLWVRKDRILILNKLKCSYLYVKSNFISFVI